MKIFFHIGPHKTGTTSIQSYFRERFGNEQAAVPMWYPTPARGGPGHSQLAQQMVEHAKSGGQNPLSGVIEEAETAGVEKLLLSSENFSVATGKVLEAYAESLKERDVTLIITHNSLIHRAASRWQEWIKGRKTERLQDAVNLILQSPGYSPLLATSFAEAIMPSEIAIVYAAPNNKPNVLIEDMNACLGVENIPDISTDRLLNRSLGWIEVETLRCFNKLAAKHAPEMTGAEYDRLRRKLLSIFNSQSWREDCPYIPIEPTDEIIAAASSRADEISDQIDILSTRYNVREYGDRATLKMLRNQRGMSLEPLAPSESIS